MKILLIAVCMLAFVNATHAQEHFYYYKGQKQALELDLSTIALTIDGSGTTPEAIRASLLRDNRESITVLREDNTRRLLTPVDRLHLYREYTLCCLPPQRVQ
jgi:hypothetical protein